MWETVARFMFLKVSQMGEIVYFMKWTCILLYQQVAIRQCEGTPNSFIALKFPAKIIKILLLRL